MVSKRTTARGKRDHRDGERSSRRSLMYIAGGAAGIIVAGLILALVLDRTIGESNPVSLEDVTATAGRSDDGRAQAVRQYLFDEHQDKDWYANLVTVRGEDNAIEVETRYEDNDPGKARAQQICEAVSTYIFGEEGRSSGFSSIQVYGQSNDLLASRANRNALCSTTD